MPLNAEGLAVSRTLQESREAIAKRVTNLYFEARPQLEQRWKGARRKCTEDNCYHLDHLCAALSFGQPALFAEYIAWTAALLAGLNIDGEALAFNLGLLRNTLDLELEGAGAALASKYLDMGLRIIEGVVPKPPEYIDGIGALDVLARGYLEALLQGDRQSARHLIFAEVDRGTSIKDIYLLVFQRVLREVGRLWHSNRIGVGQEHYCTACTQFIMSQLYPRIFSNEKKGRRLVSACVGGDLHEIGMRMVTDFFEMEGWDTFYLGANTPTSGTLQLVAQRKPHVLAISATMPIHLQAVADLIAASRAAGNPARILVGGAPFNSVPGLWEDVGADGYARDAAEAITVAGEWCA
jgi:methanogenic corrinoid protein MtbC1